MRVRMTVVLALGLAVPTAAAAAPLSRITVAVEGGVVRVADVPVPPRRPGRAQVVGRVEDGKVVPIAPTAFAARSEGPVASLFAEAEAAGGTPPPVTALATPVAVTIAEPATPMLAGHNGGASFESVGSRSGALKGALDALKADRYAEAIQRRNGLKDPLDQKIVDYFLVRSGTDQLSSAMIADYARRAPGWPDSDLVRVRAEEALSRERPSADVVIRSMGGRATSDAGIRLLAKAYLAKGDTASAQRLVRSVWQRKAMGLPMQAAYAKDFGSILTIDDHLDRIDKLIALERFSEAEGLRDRLGTGPRAYLAARVAAGQGAEARSLLNNVPGDLKRRPGYRLAEIEYLRHRENIDAAAKLIEATPNRGLVDGDPWWVETRIIARDLAERGDGRRAYKLVTRGYAVDPKEKADEAFHAGWFALVYLKDGRTAERHFEALQAIATTPLTVSRAAYWSGRAAESRGDSGAARRHYQDAARYGFTYYGQLARATMGLSGTGVERGPNVTAADRAAIQRNEVAEAVRRLIANGHEHRVWPLLDGLSETVPTAGQEALVAELARKAGAPHLALMVAKEGQRRGLEVGRLAYPTTEIPRTAQIPAGLDPALVYAIARQESLFNAGAVSPVGARGLMQVMPQTAQAIAREIGVAHSPAKLNDPAYNATLGAAYLKKRLGNFNGSYILTFAAYNAGASKVQDWIVRFGDPRDPRVDPITWVESIPYPETRNYVQRVMENVQVYREALGSGRLAIGEDLGRGRSS